MLTYKQRGKIFSLITAKNFEQKRAWESQLFCIARLFTQAFTQKKTMRVQLHKVLCLMIIVGVTQGSSLGGATQGRPLRHKSSLHVAMIPVCQKPEESTLRQQLSVVMSRSASYREALPLLQPSDEVKVFMNASTDDCPHNEMEKSHATEYRLRSSTAW